MPDERDEEPGGPTPPASHDEYPGPRQASSGERVEPDPGAPRPPGHAGARQGAPSAGSDRSTRPRGGPASTTEGSPPLRPSDDEGSPPRTEVPAFPHRADHDRAPDNG